MLLILIIVIVLVIIIIIIIVIYSCLGALSHVHVYTDLAVL